MIFGTLAVLGMSGGFGGVVNFVLERPFATISLYALIAIICIALADDGPNSQGY